MKGKTVRLPSLAYGTGVIENYRLIDCQVLGPAVIAMLENVTATRCHFDSPDWESMFWPHPSRAAMVGAIGIRNSEFVDCTFHDVGVTAPPEVEAQVRAGFGPGSAAPRV